MRLGWWRSGWLRAQRVFTANRRSTADPSVELFGFDKAGRRVTVYCFNVLDADFGPGFVKVCS